MTITLRPETEARLLERAEREGAEREGAEREGADVNAIADALVVAGLEWESWEQAEATESLRRALAESDAGKVRLFSEVAAEWRAKYDLPTHLSDEELVAGETVDARL